MSVLENKMMKMLLIEGDRNLCKVAINPFITSKLKFIFVTNYKLQTSSYQANFPYKLSLKDPYRINRSLAFVYLRLE